MTVKADIEALSAQGLSYKQIMGRLSISRSHLQVVLSGLHGGGHDASIPSSEDHARHVGAVLREGGYPYAVVRQGRTYWLRAGTQ
jgi:hypothetical protein